MASGIQAQPASVEALTVCEAAKQWPEVEGKAFAFIGRLEFRQQGRTLSEDNCVKSGSPPRTVYLRMSYESKSAPRVKTGWEVTGSILSGKLTSVRQSTKLASFRFGTPDYDRWAVVYGSLQRKGIDEIELNVAGDGYVLIVNDRVLTSNK